MSKKEIESCLSGNPALDIRIAILRAIATAWGSESVREELNHFSACRTISWLTDKFGYQPPSRNFGIKFLPAEAKWDLFSDYQWTKHRREVIKITLPKLPKALEASQTEKAEKLMEYYNHFPTFFGTKGKAVYGEERAVTTHNDNTEELDLLIDRHDKTFKLPDNFLIKDSKDVHGDNYDLGDSQDIFFSFSAALIKLIAATWNDQKLFDLVDYDKRVREPLKHIESSTARHELVSNYYAEMEEIFNRYFQYESKWKFNIEFVVAADDSFWCKRADGRDGYIWNEDAIIRNTLLIEIPHAPAKNTDNVAMALARYNAMGPAYPFTCS